VILDLDKFIATEKNCWTELEQLIGRLENRSAFKLNLEGLKRFHYLYQRTAADLVKWTTFSAESDMRHYLENLVARAYSQIHETRVQRLRFRPMRFFFQDFPQTIRRHINALWLSIAVFLIGCAFGITVMHLDSGTKEILLPFAHLEISPAERVAKEEKAAGEQDRLKGRKTTFSAQLMANNIRVSIMALALGMTWGIGTLILLFYNGIILGAVSLDYILGGQTKFLVGWLLPHGSIEIPAILLAGQAGLVLANALIGWGQPIGMRDRLRKTVNDLMIFIFGIALLLVWAGLIEAFFSQYHEPVIPYEIKIGFGVIQLILLIAFIKWSGRKAEEKDLSPQRH
jgi:uncharacterized membrane protein SpoIIM required for sporulation